MKGVTIIAIVAAVFLLAGTVFVAADFLQGGEESSGGAGAEPSATASTGSCAAGSCGAGCAGSCGGTCGVKSCGCGR